MKKTHAFVLVAILGGVAIGGAVANMRQEHGQVVPPAIPTEPHKRTVSLLFQPSCIGPQLGWNNEFETIRIRLTDFLANGSGLDLTDMEAIRFEFGGASGSDVGRIGLDDIVLTND